VKKVAIWHIFAIWQQKPLRALKNIFETVAEDNPTAPLIKKIYIWYGFDSRV